MQDSDILLSDMDADGIQRLTLNDTRRRKVVSRRWWKFEVGVISG